MNILCLIALLVSVYLISNMKYQEDFRNFWIANPYLKRNMSYDLRGGIDNRRGGAIFGEMTGKAEKVDSTGSFYNETIGKN